MGPNASKTEGKASRTKIAREGENGRRRAKSDVWCVTETKNGRLEGKTLKLWGKFSGKVFGMGLSSENRAGRRAIVSKKTWIVAHRGGGRGRCSKMDWFSDNTEKS